VHVTTLCRRAVLCGMPLTCCTLHGCCLFVLPLIAASPLPSVATAVRLYGCRMRHPPKDSCRMRTTSAAQRLHVGATLVTSRKAGCSAGAAHQTRDGWSTGQPEHLPECRTVGSCTCCRRPLSHGREQRQHSCGEPRWQAPLLRRQGRPERTDDLRRQLAAGHEPAPHTALQAERSAEAVMVTPAVEPCWSKSNVRYATSDILAASTVLWLAEAMQADCSAPACLA